MKNSALAEKLPYWHFDGNFMVFSDGSVGGGFQLQGFDISFLNDASINAFNLKIENLLNALPEDTRLQVFYKMTPNVEKLLRNHEEISSKAIETYGPISKARHAFFQENATQKNYFVPEIYLFIRSEPYPYKRKKIFEKVEPYQSILVDDYKKFQERFSRTLAQVESALHQCNLNPEALKSEMWFDLIFESMNFSRASRVGPSHLRMSQGIGAASLPSQLALTDLQIERDAVKQDDHYFRVITLKLLPEGQTYSSMIHQFTKMPFHFWICQNIRILNQRREIEKLELNRRFAHSMVSGSHNVSDLESESKLDQIEGLLRELWDGSERLVSMDFNVVVWGREKPELDQKSDEFLRGFRSLSQSEGLVETLAAIDGFFASLPGSCKGFREKKMKSSNAANLMPLYGSWLGNSRPVCLLPNRDGGLFSIDPFAKELPAWNGCLIGGTGSGKSFTIAQLMLQFYGQAPRPRIIWIDNGASSQKLLEVLDGEFIDLNLDSGICLNMFDLDSGETVPSSSKIKLILGVLELILKDEEKKGLPKREKALLEEVIFETYRRAEGKTPVLSDLRNILREHAVEEMRKFAQVLFSWTGATAYGKMLDRPSNVRLSKDLITIEVKGLDNSQDLKDIFLLLFTSFIKNAAASDLARPYLLIIDEAARLFLTPSGKDFAIECYRTFRKYNAGIFCISQNYRDFLSDPELADALLPNTTSIFILRQRKIDWNDFKEKFDFNDTQVEAVKSLEVAKGKFSEFFYMQDENQAVLRLVPEPLSYWICTSDGNDKTLIAEMEHKFPELPKIEILQLLANQKKESL